MSNPKYICYTGTFPSIIMFDAATDHFVMARRMGLTKETIRGAGFVSLFSHDGPECYGRSTTLGIDMHDDDSRVLRLMLGVED